MGTADDPRVVGASVPAWTARPLPPRGPMVGRTCAVVPLTSAHADPLFAAYAEAPDGRDWTYLPIDRPDDRVAWRRQIAQEVRSADPLHHAILVPGQEGAARGKASFMRIDPANGVIEIGWIALSPALMRSTAATEAIYLMMRRVFDELGYRRLEWKCDSLNQPSRRAAERFGFVYEGTFRQAVVTKGRNRDTAWYAMIDRDWPAARTAFESWLAPANFTMDGRQMRPLASFRLG